MIQPDPSTDRTGAAQPGPDPSTDRTGAAPEPTPDLLGNLVTWTDRESVHHRHVGIAIGRLPGGNYEVAELHTVTVHASNLIERTI